MEYQLKEGEVLTVSNLSAEERDKERQSMGAARLPPTLLAQCGFLRHPALLATHVIQVVTSSGKIPINALSDEGSQITLVSQKAVSRMKLGPGVPWTMFLQVVGSQYREVQTELYTLRLQDRKGQIREVTAAAVATVASCGRGLDLQPLRQLFPHARDEAFERPQGEIDLLIGSCDRSLLPSGVLELVGDLALESTPWGCGQVFRGSHHLLGDPGPVGGLSVEAHTASCCLLQLPPGGERLTGMSLGEKGKAMVIQEKKEAEVEQEGMEAPAQVKIGFIEAEELGTRPKARCPQHSDCESCSMLLEGMSRKEQEVILRMYKEMKVEGGKVVIAYPWNHQLLKRMRSNRRQAFIVQDRIRKDLKRRGWLEEFDKEVRKKLDSGAVSIVPEDEIRGWEQDGGPIHYLTVFGVSQPSHAGHTLRVVSNMKMKNNHSGLSPNECMDRPPNALVALLSVLLWWRTSLHCAVVDISRAYETVLTGPTEKFMRLALWKTSEEGPWVVLGYNTMSFGDQPAAAGLELAKAEAARLGASVDAHTAEQISKKMYVDDGALAADSREQLEAMRGSRREDGTYTGHIAEVLKTVGMAPKFVAIPGTATPEEVELLGGKVLGVGYKICEDKLVFKLSTRASIQEPGRRKKVLVEWSRGELEEMRQGRRGLSLRSALSWTMSFFDPLGLLSPFTLRAKLLLRRLQGKGTPVPWDQDMPQLERQRWVELLLEVLDGDEVTFYRAAAPPEGVSVDIVVFADGSMEAFCAAVYAVWRMPGMEDKNDSALVMAKCRLTPLTGTTIPRSELSGLVVAHRLALLVAAAANYKPANLNILTDSECSIALSRKTGGLLRPFSANRVGEIEDLRKEIQHEVGVLEPLAAVPGDQNPADLGTRGKVTLKDMQCDWWQKGPAWLSQPRTTWPLNTDLTQQAPFKELRAARVAGALTVEQPVTQHCGLFELCNPHLLSTKSLEELKTQLENGTEEAETREELVTWARQKVSPKSRRARKMKPEERLRTCCKVALDGHQEAWEEFRKEEEAGLRPPERGSLQKVTEGIASWGGQWLRLAHVVKTTLAYTNCWSKAERITVRVCRLLFKTAASWCVASPGCWEDLLPEELEAARRLHFLAAAPASLAALRLGKLQSLGAVEEGGEVLVGGRVQPDELRAILGLSTLKVVMPSERLAYLILLACHQEDHRKDVRDCLARSRRVCWIPQARALAKSIIASCLVCRREEKKTQKQVMGVLPSFTSPTLAPFVACGVDLMGPYMVQEQKNRKSTYKAWAVVYTCFSTKACVFILAAGYSAADFLRAHSRFTNTYGPVSLCLVDHGSNLMAAAFRPDWREVSGAVGMAGTTWLVTPKGAAWRNGQAERHIGLCKGILNRILAGRAFSGTFEEMEALLSRCSWIMNSRPLAVRTFTESDFALLCPNDVLLGRAGRVGQPEVELAELEDVTLVQSLTHMEAVARAFYRALVKETFPEMVPRRKWRWQERDSRVGDIGFLVYPSKFGKPWYRPCRVVAVHPDLQGTVRTVTVAFRTRRGEAAKKSPELVPAPLETMLVPVQRVAIMLPVEEQGEVRSLEMVGPAEQLKQALESQRKQELVLSQARQAAGLLEEEAELEKRLEEEGGCSLPGLRRSARVQARAGALLVLHTLEQGVQLQLAAGPAGWEEVYPCRDFEDDKI